MRIFITAGMYVGLLSYCVGLMYGCMHERMNAGVCVST